MENSLTKSAKLISENDVIGWRRLTSEIRSKTYSDMLTWRKSNEDGRSSIENYLDVWEIYGPLISISLVGLEAGLRPYCSDILDDVLYPDNWPLSGSVDLIAAPYAAGFLYQALYGALCMLTKQPDLAIRLAERPMVLNDRHDYRANPLLCHSVDLVMGPPLLSRKFRISWKSVVGLYSEWPWLAPIFGSPKRYEAALCAYYQLLSIVECCENIVRKNVSGLVVPVEPFRIESEDQQRSYSLLIQDASALRNIWKSKGISDELFAEHWLELVKILGNKADPTWGGVVPHTGLAKDLLGLSR